MFRVLRRLPSPRSIFQHTLIATPLAVAFLHKRRQVRHHRVHRQRTESHLAVAARQQVAQIEHHLAQIQFAVRHRDGSGRRLQLLARQPVGAPPRLRRVVQLQTQPSVHRIRAQLLAKALERE